VILAGEGASGFPFRPRRVPLEGAESGLPSGEGERTLKNSAMPQRWERRREE